jgi:hypothetical protein
VVVVVFAITIEATRGGIHNENIEKVLDNMTSPFGAF